MSVSDLVQALQDFFSSLVGGLLDFLLNLLITAIQILFFPIDALFSTFFSGFSNNLSTVTNNINNFIQTVATMPLSWFVNILPSMTKTALFIYLGFLASYYVFAFSYRALRVAINLFHKIKFW